MIPITSIVHNSNKTWQFAWDDDGSVFWRVILWGRELAKVTTPTYTWRGQEYITLPPPLEIATENSLVLSEQYIPYTILQWYSEECSEYLVQKSDDGVTGWTTIQRIQELGQWLNSYKTITQTDETTYYYRVLAVDSLGNQSPARQYTRYVVCPPRNPDATITIGYSGPSVHQVEIAAV